MDWKKYLSQFQQAYKEADAVDSEFDELPDGDYVARVERVELKQSKSGKPMMEWEFVVHDGQYTGRREWKYNLIDSVDRVQWLKKDLFKAGLNLEDITKLEESLPLLLDRILEIRIKTKKGNNGQTYRNIYIKKHLETYKPQQTNGVPTNSADPFANDGKPLNITDDDLPF